MRLKAIIRSESDAAKADTRTFSISHNTAGVNSVKRMTLHYGSCDARFVSACISEYNIAVSEPC